VAWVKKNCKVRPHGNQKTSTFSFLRKVQIELKTLSTCINNTPCVPKKSTFLFVVNNFVKNWLILTIFGMLHPEKIWHEYLTDLSTSLVWGSYFTLGNSKKGPEGKRWEREEKERGKETNRTERVEEELLNLRTAWLSLHCVFVTQVLRVQLVTLNITENTVHRKGQTVHNILMFFVQIHYAKPLSCKNFWSSLRQTFMF